MHHNGLVLRGCVVVPPLVVCSVCPACASRCLSCQGCGLLRTAASSDSRLLRRGELIEQHGCGPHPIPANELSEKGLVAALRHMQAAPVQAAAARLAALLAKEQGARDAAAAIHRHLPRRAMLCDLDPTRRAGALSSPSRAASCRSSPAVNQTV